VKRPFVIVAAVAIMAAGSGYFAARMLSPADIPGAAMSRSGSAVASSALVELVGQRRPDFHLADAAGQTVSVDRFDGQVLLLNFWATWCAPCVEEMPMLSRLHQDYAGRGFTVVGIALDEPQRAREFAQELGVGYPVLFGLADAMVVGRRYGNGTGMLPYSVLVDANGIVRWTRLGVLDRSQVETQLASLF